MKIGISKSLESAMAQAVFNTAQVGTRCSLKDCLMLQILAAEGSKAFNVLKSMLQDWQLHQVRLRLERVAYRMGHDTASPDLFYKGYSKRLIERFGGEGRLYHTRSNGHLGGYNYPILTHIRAIQHHSRAIRYAGGEERK